MRLALALSLVLASCSGRPAAPAGPDAPPFADGGAVGMPDSTRARLVAADPLWETALRLHYDALVMDGHVDVPELMVDEGYDLGVRHAPQERKYHVDLPKMAEGGLDAPFFSIYVSRTFGEGPEATARAMAQIAALEAQVAAHPDQIGMARTADDVRRLTRAGRRAALMGLEGGHALQGSPDVLRQLFEAGIRYVTLTHSNTNGWADSSQDRPRHGGLSPLGVTLVREMNRLGVLVDLSHVSDSTFADAVRVSHAPVIASHSSARARTGHVRNLTDAQLRAVGRAGGVVMVTFVESFTSRHLTPDFWADIYARIDSAHAGDLAALSRVVEAEQVARGLAKGTIEDVIEHVAHVARVAGVDHTGLGSDFDGAPMPPGLEDARRLPWITYGLLKRGFSERDVRQILGLNTLRVLEQAEQVAGDLQRGG